MRRRLAWIWLVQSISLSRMLAAILFASLAFQHVPLALLLGLYVFAVATDVIDGYLARRLKAATYFGKVLDLVGDKSLTIVSLLYAAACGISIAPLVLIATREVITIGMRMIIVKGTPLLPTSRVLGGIMAIVLWGNTLLLVVAGADQKLVSIVNATYWFCAFILVLTLAVRVYSNVDRIKASLTEDS